MKSDTGTVNTRRSAALRRLWLAMRFLATLAGTTTFVDENWSLASVELTSEGTGCRFLEGGTALVDDALGHFVRPFRASFQLLELGLGAAVGMASSSADRDCPLGTQSESVAVHSDGSRGMAHAFGHSHGLVAPLCAGDTVCLDVDARNVLCISRNGCVLSRVENIPDDWHFAVGSFGTARRPSQNADADAEAAESTRWELIAHGPPSLTVTPLHRAAMRERAAAGNRIKTALPGSPRPSPRVARTPAGGSPAIAIPCELPPSSETLQVSAG